MADDAYKATRVPIREKWVADMSPQFTSDFGTDEDGEPLPVDIYDARPFDWATEYRMPPIRVREGDRVSLIYPIITKAEHDGVGGPPLYGRA